MEWAPSPGDFSLWPCFFSQVPSVRCQPKFFDNKRKEVIGLRLQGVILNTLVYDIPVHNGSQWALHNTSDVYGP